MSPLHTRHLPRAGKPALVLVHGWGLHGEVWNACLPALQPHFDLCLVDLPGLGRSAGATLDPYRLDTVADLLADAVPEPALWLGWSLGGLACAALARRHLDRVRGLVTLATTPAFVQQPDWPCAMAPETFEAFQAGIDRDTAKTLNRFLMLQGQGDARGRQVIKQLKGCLALYDVLPPSQLAESLALLAGDYRGLFAGLAQPRLHLFGEGDALVPAAVAARAEVRAQARVLAGVGHVPFLSDPEPVVEAMVAFAREVDLGL